MEWIKEAERANVEVKTTKRGDDSIKG